MAYAMDAAMADPDTVWAPTVDRDIIEADMVVEDMAGEDMVRAPTVDRDIIEADMVVAAMAGEDMVVEDIVEASIQTAFMQTIFNIPRALSQRDSALQPRVGRMK